MSSTVPELLMRGPQLGTMFAMALYGITCMQTFLYYQNYSDDRQTIKLTVAVIWVLETVHAGLAIGSLDHYLIVNFSELGVMLSVHWTMSVTYMIGFFIAFIVNLYYTWRIWVLSRQWYIPAFLIVLATTRLGCSLAACVYSLIYSESWLVFGKNSKAIVIVSIILAIATDTANSVILAYFLQKRRSSSGLRRTSRLINNLLIYIVGSGALAVVIDVAELIVYLSVPNTLYYLGMVLIQMKLYSNAFLTSLNIRHYQAQAITKVPLGDQFNSSSDAPTFSAGHYKESGSALKLAVL